MGVVPKMPAAVPPPVAVLVAAIVASSIFASPCTAGRPPTTAVDAGGAGPPAEPLVEDIPTTVAAQDFIRTRCSQSCYRPEDQRTCYEHLLPYATSINGSYNRATIAGFTAMLSRLTWFLEGKLDDPPVPGECIQVVKDTISGAKEALAKLGRIDDTVAATNPDLNDVKTWILAVAHNLDKCPDTAGSRGHAGDMAIIKDYVSINDGLVTSSKPFHANSLPSPDGTDPFTN